MGGIWNRTGGKITLNATDVHCSRRGEHARGCGGQIRVIFKAYNLVSDMSVFENVELPLTYRGEIQHKSRRDLVIGGASCRERVEISVVAESLKKKRKEDRGDAPPDSQGQHK